LGSDGDGAAVGSSGREGGGIVSVKRFVANRCAKCRSRGEAHKDWQEFLSFTGEERFTKTKVQRSTERTMLTAIGKLASAGVCRAKVF
jgi:hypothetical protein